MGQHGCWSSNRHILTLARERGREGGQKRRTFYLIQLPIRGFPRSLTDNPPIIAADNEGKGEGADGGHTNVL